ncbi:unnamed protein product [Toxocara canis]|uniref:C2H2-type domain-containing protein n=1 Tax=Toxocara canis TaxID=6265 RepID=A0A183V9H7_TOXCA|nr:unnamed protein product [Toxocara canis]
MMHVESHLFSLPEIKTAEPAALPPVVISPTEVDHVTVTLEKNQQCACKDCGKLFNSVWYLKQHAVKHSNDRPFRCKFCLKCPSSTKRKRRNIGRKHSNSKWNLEVIDIVVVMGM